MSIAISVSAIKKIYPRRWASPPCMALNDVSLEIMSGETFGFIGPNGAGKSTLIKILTGAVHASAGTAKIFGVDVSDPRSRSGLGYVPENPSLPDYLTPLEILTMGLRLHHVGVDKPTQHGMRWLERFDLGMVANKTIRSFSKGMAQRTALAHAMAVQPRLLILDEPLSGLDPIGRRDVVDILAEFRNEGGTLFLTSHVLHDVERLADRFGLIHSGELRAVRAPGEFVGERERVLVRSQGATPVEGMIAEPGGRWVIEINRGDLWALLRRLESEKHAVLEIKATLSLESAFMQLVKGQ